MPRSDDPFLPLTVQIVSAHVEHNSVEASELPALIRSVYRALAASVPQSPAPRPTTLVAETVKPVTAAARKAAEKSVFDDHLVCMECGLSMKMLKRHLQTVHNLSPSQYRAKFQLAGDYPMVARQYAALRSSLAKESGLGKRPVHGGR